MACLAAKSELFLALYFDHTLILFDQFNDTLSIAVNQKGVNIFTEKRLNILIFGPTFPKEIGSKYVFAVGLFPT